MRILMLRNVFQGLLTGLIVCLTTNSHAAVDVAGVAYQDPARVEDSALVLNGAGVRSMFLFKLYTVGLYLRQKTTDAELAIAQTGAKRIRIVSLQSVGIERFVSGLMKGLAKNHSPAQLVFLKPRADQFAGQLKSIGQLAAGNVVTLDALPGGSTRLALNGNAIGPDIPGADFYQALMRIWLGDKPAQDDLKASLLGR